MEMLRRLVLVLCTAFIIHNFRLDAEGDDKLASPVNHGLDGNNSRSSHTDPATSTNSSTTNEPTTVSSEASSSLRVQTTEAVSETTTASITLSSEVAEPTDANSCTGNCSMDVTSTRLTSPADMTVSTASGIEEKTTANLNESTSESVNASEVTSPPLISKLSPKQDNLSTTAVPQQTNKAKTKPRLTLNAESGDKSSHFLIYLLVVCVLSVFGYLAYHNRKKVAGCLVEGRSRSNKDRARPRSRDYVKLEEQSDGHSSSKTYVY